MCARRFQQVAAHNQVMTIIDAQGAHHGAKGLYTNKPLRDAKFSLVGSFEAARTAQREAHVATMEAAQEALPAIVFDHDPEIVEVTFGWGEYGLYALNAKTIDGDEFPLTDNAKLHNEIWDLFLALDDYQWVRYESKLTTNDDGETFSLAIPGDRPVHRHIATLAHESGWGLATDVFDILYNREEFEDEDFLAITGPTLTDLVEKEFVPGIDSLTTELSSASPTIDHSRAGEVHDHIAEVTKDAYYESMETFLSVIYDRGEVSDEAFLALTTADIHRLYDAHIDLAIDRVERALHDRIDNGTL